MRATTPRRLKHDNICRLLGTCVTPQSPNTVVTELLDGDLRKLIAQPELLPSYYERLSWMVQLARGVAYMHERDFVHQDIKLGTRRQPPLHTHSTPLTNEAALYRRCRRRRRLTDNVLYRNLPDGSKEIKICDFGLTRRMLGASFSNPARIGTALYMSPEVLMASEYLTHKIDVYCFALALWELLAAQKAFADQTKFSDLRNLVLAGVRPLVPAWCSSRLRELFHLCWAHDPEERPTMAQIVIELEDILRENELMAPAYDASSAMLRKPWPFASTATSSSSTSSSSSSSSSISASSPSSSVEAAMASSSSSSVASPGHSLCFAAMPTELA